MSFLVKNNKEQIYSRGKNKKKRKLCNKCKASFSKSTLSYLHLFEYKRYKKQTC